MNVQTLMGLAQDAVDSGNIEAACEFYEVALQKEPDNGDILEAYAEIMIHFAGDANRGEQMLRHAIDLNPDTGYIKYMSLAQLLNGREAEGCYRRAVDLLRAELSMTRKKRGKESIRRTLSTVFCAIAELFMTDLCDEETAEDDCEAAVNEAQIQCTDNVEVWQVMGSLRISQERPEDAVECLLRAVALSHRLPETKQPTYESKIELGKLLLQVDPTQAFQWLLEVLSLDDTNPYVWFLLSEAARARNRLHDSARLLKRARIMVNPDDEMAVNDIEDAIRSLVEMLGGEQAANDIPFMDDPNPLDHLEAEDDTEAGLEMENPDQLDSEGEWEDEEDC